MNVSIRAATVDRVPSPCRILNLSDLTKNEKSYNCVVCIQISLISNVEPANTHKTKI